MNNNASKGGQGQPGRDAIGSVGGTGGAGGIGGEGQVTGGAGGTGGKGGNVIKGWRAYIFAIIVIILAVWLPLYYSVGISVNHNRHGCERLDTVRTTLYQQIKDSAAVSESLAQESTGAERQIHLQLIKIYEQRAEDLRNSVKPYQIRKGSIHIDCVRAYPMPFPLSAFD